jgi:hypothetical protein
MRLTPFALAVCCAAVLALPAGASHPRAIVLGSSIGPVRLGMSERAVVRALGAPRSAENANYGGKPLRRAIYGFHGGRFEVSYDRASRRVVGIATTSGYFRTPNGLGPGAPLARIRAGGFRFSQCTANWERLVGRVHVSFIVTSAKAESIYMIRSAYTSC